jgi:hypothetical protein
MPGTDSTEARTKILEEIVRRIEQQSADATDILKLAEAHAWLTTPGEPH